MGFAEGFFRAKAQKLAEKRFKLQQKLTEAQIEEAGVRAGVALDKKQAAERLLTPDSGPLPGQIGPPTPQEQSITSRLAAGQTDTIADAVRSGLLGEFKKLQEVQQGPAPFSNEGKQQADVLSFVKKFGADSAEVAALEGRFTATDAIKPAEIRQTRQQFVNLSKDNLTGLSAFDKISTAAKDPTGAGDIAMIFNFMKLLDPGSRVTEGEVALAGQVSGAASQFLNLYNRLVKGDKLTSTARQDILFQAANIARETVANQRGLESEFTGIAERLGAKDVRDIVLFGDQVAETEKRLVGIKKPEKDLGSTAKEAESTLSKVGKAIRGVFDGGSSAPPIEEMSIAEIDQLLQGGDLTDEQLAAVKKRMAALGVEIDG